MEQLQIELTNTETIKPSTPNGPHPESYKLCLLDQLFQFIYIPQVLFYRTPSHYDQISLLARLKESLSRTLSLFYPVSGRFTPDESSVDCNDNGISFIEAQARGSLLAFLESPNRVDLLCQFLPHDIYDCINARSSNDSNNKASTVTRLIPLVVQVTTFEYGGIAIGYQWLHKILDGASWGSFLKTWAAFASGRYNDVIVPDFATAFSLFPPCSSSTGGVPPSAGNTPSIVYQTYDNNIQVDKSCVVKAFSFSPQAIATLQDEARSENVPHPTRVEVASGFIWKHVMKAASNLVKSKSESQGGAPSVLIHAVDMRPCTRPPLPPTVIGNLITQAIAYSDLAQKPNADLRELVAEIRRGISKAKDHEFLSNFQGENGAPIVLKHSQNIGNIINDTNASTYKFSSWSSSRLGLNADFGFGAPVWVGFIGGRLGPIMRNTVVLIETMEKAIEAWLVLIDEEMEVLQFDSEFLAFARLLIN